MPKSSLEAAIKAIDATLAQAEALVTALTSAQQLLMTAAQEKTFAPNVSDVVPQSILARLEVLEKQLASGQKAAPTVEEKAEETSSITAVEPVANTMIGRPAAAPRAQGAYEVPSLEALPAIASALSSTTPGDDSEPDIDFDSLNNLTSEMLDTEERPSADRETADTYKAADAGKEDGSNFLPASSGPILI